MNVAEISTNVHYIGVNDRRTDLFESLWPLPYGVSYNSYLVAGPEKVAIIDGVEAAYALEQIGHIREILGDRKPDYLVINHMEPDHSGAIRILREVYPDITIVATRQALDMVKGYYGEEASTIAVKEGDSISLGEGATLRFVPIPMVHWPETMVSILEEEKILFSGDAFGCFGALNGGVTDEEMSTDHYFPEMLRYYSNIVGKYGAFVQKALKKLESVEIAAICPTHGPVWRGRIAEVVGLYDRLSRYEPLDNGVTIIYGSMYGNTARLAEEAARALTAAGVRDISIHDASRSGHSYIISDIFRHRGLIVAAPTYNDTLFPPVKTLLDAIATRGVKNREVLLFGSNTWAQRAVPVMEEILAKAGIEPIASPVVMKQSASADVIAAVRQSAAALAARLATFNQQLD